MSNFRLVRVPDSEFPSARDFVVNDFSARWAKTTAGYNSDPNMLDCKMYHDGSHFVVSVDGENRFTRKVIPRTEWDDIFDLIISDPEYKQLRAKSREDLFKKQRRYIRFMLDVGYCYNGSEDLNAFVERKLFNMAQAKAARKRTFRRKSGLITWTFFCTFTYDSKLMSEDKFRFSLIRRLNNLHTNHGWLFAGSFERGAKTDRLHFHCLVSVPEAERGSDRLKLYERKGFDPDTGRIKKIQSNRYFDNFGRNDFETIDSGSRSVVNSKMEYIMKYIEKSGEKMFYSRGVPTYVVMRFKKSDFVGTMINTNRRVFVRHILVDGIVTKINDKYVRTDPIPIFPPVQNDRAQYV